jgi:predicted O-linked N-acetylglucosamine transferase (SPINDLY family)
MLMTDMSPLSLCAYSDDPILQLASASRHNKVSVGIPTVNLQMEQRPANVVSDSGRRRIGYLSSDLRGHAIGYLMAELFELHDRSAFEVFVYYCGPQASDAMQARIKSSVEHWVDISRMNDDTAARRIAADGIDILIDVNGYTRDARTKVAAMRPAPIIVNWLGYPGTMASPYHHYIIADEWIIPKDHEIYFSERVLRLPCYQPNDRKRVTSPTPPSRQQAGLPDDAFVYCCFNGVQKLTRFTFERWMSILERVPNSVLWLLDGTDVVNKHLAATAERHGIAPERLVFASKMGHSDHLARYSLADLFLDTVPYGAHTTASDALWAGVPILTLSGRSFASRVCGSLARSAGLAELVCNTPEEYVERAVALANDRPKIQQYKQHLAATRDSCVLFKTDDLVQHLEALYRQMYEEFQQGMLPSPDLRNLDVYHDVGLEEDHDALEVMTVKNYLEWYNAKLARRHALWPISADSRLWTS